MVKDIQVGRSDAVLHHIVITTPRLFAHKHPSVPGCSGYNTSICGGLDMQLLWNIFYISVPVVVFVIIPFMTFYYEADDGLLMAGTQYAGARKCKMVEAMKYEFLVLIIVGVIFIACYLTLKDASIPVRNYAGTLNGSSYNINATQSYNATFDPYYLQDMTASDSTYYNAVISYPLSDITLTVTIFTFFAAFMAFFGWFFFAIFGGVGLSAVPLDLILIFKNRPRHMDAVEFAETQMSLRDRVNQLVDVGELLKIEQEEKRKEGRKGMMHRMSKDGRQDRKIILELKRALFLLEQDVEEFKACSENYKNYNPLVPYAALLAGIIAFIISATWIVQISVYVLPKDPAHSFLNSYFEWFDTWFPLFGILSVALYSFYLMICTVKGCFKFGMRLMCLTLHPMIVNKTYMSSFLFNVGLVLLCSLPIIQFTTMSFADYARNTNVYQVMGAQVQYVKFFRWFWTKNVFVIALLTMAGLTMAYLACKPSDKKAGSNSLALRNRVRARRVKS
jgi:LMBR1 domain-containing protein 1